MFSLINQTRFSLKPLSKCAVLVLVLLISALSLSGCTDSLKNLPLVGSLFPGASDPGSEPASETETIEEEEGSTDSEATHKQEAPTVTLKPYTRLSQFPSQMIEWVSPQGFLMTAQLLDPAQVMQQQEALLHPPPPVDEEEEPADEATSDEESEEATAPEVAAPVPPAVRYPLLILLHGANSDRLSWEVFAIEQVKRGYAVLLVDLPGHGQSARLATGGYKYWRRFEAKDWQQFTNTLLAFYKALYKTELQKHLQVSPKQAVLLGSGLGANVALVLAGKASDLTAGVATLDASLNAKGVEPALAMLDYEGPMFFAASSTDSSAYSGTERLYRISLGQKKLSLHNDIGSGLDMLRFHPALKEELEAWLNSVLPPVATDEKLWRFVPPKPPQPEEETAEDEEAV